MRLVAHLGAEAGLAKCDRLTGDGACRSSQVAPSALTCASMGRSERTASLPQSYARVGKFALIKHQRSAHAKQFRRAQRRLKTLQTQLGRVIRDIVRKFKGRAPLKQAFARELMLARPKAPISGSSVFMRRKSNASAGEKRTSLTNSA